MKLKTNSIITLLSFLLIAGNLTFFISYINANGNETLHNPLEFDNLPVDLQGDIFEKAGLTELSRLELVSTKWKQIVDKVGPRLLEKQVSSDELDLVRGFLSFKLKLSKDQVPWKDIYRFLWDQGGVKAKNIMAYITITHPDSITKFEEVEKFLKEEQLKEEGYIGNSRHNPVEYVINSLISCWVAENYNDIHEAAREYYCLDCASDMYYKIEEKIYRKYLATIGLVFDSMKKLTTDWLKSQHKKTVKLYRGIALTDKLDRGFHSHQLLPLSSWSTSFDEAKKHSFKGRDFSGYSYVMVKEFSIDRILSTGVTGLGTIAENEFVVLGPKGKIDELYFIPVKE
jgi:hypothetical protein